MNKVLLIGNLTRDPEYMTTNNGVAMCRFSIAVGRTYTTANGERETDFFNCVAWRGLADNINKYCRKGNKICVSGQVQTHKWTDGEGNTRAVVDILAENVEFLFKAGDNDGDGKSSASNANARNTANTAVPSEDDGLPF